MDSMLEDIPERPEQAIQFFRDSPISLLRMLGYWWEGAVESTRCYADGMNVSRMRGFYTASRLLVLWCDSELRTIDPTPIRELSDQMWAREVKIICPHCRRGSTFTGDRCDNCGTVETECPMNPNWADGRTMLRTLDKVQPVKERIEAVTILACKQKQSAGPADLVTHKDLAIVTGREKKTLQNDAPAGRIEEHGGKAARGTFSYAVARRILVAESADYGALLPESYCDFLTILKSKNV